MFGLRASVALISLILLLASSSFASMLEVRGGYDLLQSNPSKINDSNNAGFPEFKNMTGFSGDALVGLPAFPVMLGARYEQLTTDGSNSVGSFKGKFTRTSIVISKRLIDTGIYLAPIATVGLTNQLDYDVTQGGQQFHYKATSGLTGSVGVEAGLSLGLLKIGAEAGYLYAPLGKLKYSNGTEVINTDGTSLDVNMSGTYARAVVGLSL